MLRWGCLSRASVLLTGWSKQVSWWADLTSWVAGGLRLVQLWVEFCQAQVSESLRRWRSGSLPPGRVAERGFSSRCSLTDARPAPVLTSSCP